MAAAMRDAIERFRPDVVHFCFSQMAQYYVQCPGVPAVMDTQDVAAVSAYRRITNAGNPLAKAYFFLQWLFWLRYETTYYPRFGKVLTLTRQDAAALMVFSPALDIYADATGVDIPEKPSENTGPRQRIGFLANFSHHPNLDAALFFVREIFPLIRKEVADAEFVVAGKNPPADLRAAAGDGIRLAGFVDEVAGFYAGMDVVVAPLRSGGGVKIKVLEAMASARPVVATAIGAEGIAGPDDQALLVADDPVSFAAAVVSLLRDAGQRQALGRRGRELVERRFSWHRVTEDLGQIYADLARGSR